MRAIQNDKGLLALFNLGIRHDRVTAQLGCGIASQRRQFFCHFFLITVYKPDLVQNLTGGATNLLTLLGLKRLQDQNIFRCRIQVNPAAGT